MGYLQIKKLPLIPCLISWIIGLSACCDESSSRVPEGYPFDPEIVPVKYSLYNEKYLNNSRISSEIRNMKDITLIEDTITLENLFRSVDTGFVCDVDFSKFSIIVSNGYVSNYQSNEQIRVLFDYREHRCAVERRYNSNNCGPNGKLTYTASLRSHLLLIPRIPEGFTAEYYQY